MPIGAALDVEELLAAEVEAEAGLGDRRRPPWPGRGAWRAPSCTPWAMLANGPPWTSAGPPSAVCTRLGLSASRSSAVMAPAAPTSPAVTASVGAGRPDDDAREAGLEVRRVAGQRTDRHDLARGGDVEADSARDAVELAARGRARRCGGTRSFMSSARPHVTARVDRPGRLLAEVQALSTIAESRLCAVVMAWMSPVKCRLMSSAGTSVAAPPPVPPPFTPNTGPSEGSRRARRAVPAAAAHAHRQADGRRGLALAGGVGLIAETRISRPVGSRPSSAARSTFARCGPQPITCSGAIPSSAATSVIGRRRGTVDHAGTRRCPVSLRRGCRGPAVRIVPCPSPPSPARCAAQSTVRGKPREDIGVEQRQW